MQRFIKFSPLLLFLFLFNGCALLFQGSKGKLSMDSSPDGAEVWVNGVKMGVTPCKIELKTKDEYTVEFRKEGYAPKTYMVQNHVGAGWVILDILGGLIPVIIDGASGAWYAFDEDKVNLVLEKQVAEKNQ